MSSIECPVCSAKISDRTYCCAYCGFQVDLPNRGESYLSATMRPATSWSVELCNIGEKKIKAVAKTKELFNLDLATAKEVVEQSRVIVARGSTLDRAREIAEEYMIKGIDARVIEEV